GQSWGCQIGSGAQRKWWGDFRAAPARGACGGRGQAESLLRTCECLQDAGAEAAVAALLVAGRHGGLAVLAVAVRAARAVRRLRRVRAVAARALAGRAVQLGDQRRVRLLDIPAVVVVVGADVAGLLGALLLLLEGAQHGRLDDLAAGRVDRVGDVGVQLGPAVGVARGAVLVELVAALVAVAGAQVVLAAALPAAVRQLAAGHGHERPLGALDDLQVTHHEGVVERDRAEGLEALVVVFHELDPDFGDDHSCSPFYPW